MKNNVKKKYAIIAFIILIIAALCEFFSSNLFMIDPRVYGTLVWLWQPKIIIECAFQIILAVFTITGWLPGITISAGLYACSFINNIFVFANGVNRIALLSYVRIIIFEFTLISIVVLSALAKRQKKKPAFIIAISFSLALVAISVASYVEFLFKAWATFGFYCMLGNFLYYTLTGVGLVFLSFLLWNVPAKVKDCMNP